MTTPIGLLLSLCTVACSALPGYGQSQLSLYPQALNQTVLVAPEIVPTVTAAPVLVELSQQEIVDEIRATFPEDPDTAVRVAICESRLDPKARNRNSSATGIFQVLAVTHKQAVADLQNPSFNIRFARKLYDQSEWYPWKSSEGCWGVSMK